VNFDMWRTIHRLSSATVALVAVVHCAVTPTRYARLSPDSVWFLGTGLGLILLGVMNWAHVGLEPCRMATAPVVRWANVVFLLFGLTAAIAINAPQGWVVVVGLAGQMIASWTTLRAAN
jgi:hypothetical protein